MLVPGFIINDDLQPGSMARAIEDAMVAAELIQLDEETPEAALDRRKAFIAIATGVINHLRTNLEIVVADDKFGNGIPNGSVKLLGAAGEVL